MNGFYIKKDGIANELIPVERINVGCMGIVELPTVWDCSAIVIPDSVKKVYCYHNKLTKLILTDSVEYIECYNNQLTELDLPDSVERIHCRDNYLTELIVPDDCIVDCDDTVKVITRTMFNRSKRLKAILK